MVPSSWSAQDAVMAVASEMPTTPTGTKESSLVPSPSWPYSLSPQQDMVPSSWSAQECPPPAVMAVALFVLSELLKYVLAEDGDTVGRGLSVLALSELSEQLAASRAVRVSRQKAKRLRGGVVVS